MARLSLGGMLNGERGQLALSVVQLIIALVVVFIGLFAIKQVSDVTDVSDDPDFNETFDTLVTQTGSLFQIIGVALMIVGLSLGLTVLFGLVAGVRGQGSNLTA